MSMSTFQIAAARPRAEPIYHRRPSTGEAYRPRRLCPSRFRAYASIDFDELREI